MGFFRNLFKKEKDDFKVGDFVICIDDRNWIGDKTLGIDLKYGKIYKIKQILNYKSIVGFDIGLNFHIPIYTHSNELNEYLPGAGIHWAHKRRFRKPTEDEIKKHIESIKDKLENQKKELIQNEEYEKVLEIQEQLEKIK